MGLFGSHAIVLPNNFLDTPYLKISLDKSTIKRLLGTHRPASDIDLVLYGTLDEAEAERIVTLFSESLLPYTVDVQVYHLITYPPLKTHIDASMLPLFEMSSS